MKEIPVADAFITLDNGQVGFFAWMDFNEVKRIETVGWENADTIKIRDCEERPVPTNLKDGLSTINDVFIRLEPSVEVSLN